MRSGSDPAFAVIAPGLEGPLAAELRALGATGTAEEGGVAFSASRALLYGIHRQSRLAARIWLRVGKFRATQLEALAGGVRRLDWSPFLAPRRAVTVRVTCHRSRLHHRDAIAQKVTVAIRDALRQPRRSEGLRPVREPLDVLVRIVDDEAEISVDASGELLHRRGWRRDASEAPLRENLAAAVLWLADYSPDEPLVDPMCGSGTFAIEAATIAAGLDPGASRKFAFETWPSHDAAQWNEIRRAGAAPTGRAAIFASDVDPKAVAATAANARRAGVADRVTSSVAPVDELVPPPGVGLVVVNPPYGHRIRGAREAWESLGNALRERFQGWRVAILVPEPSLLAAARLSLPKVASFSNGGLRVAVHLGPVVGPAGNASGRTARSRVR